MGPSNRVLWDKPAGVLRRCRGSLAALPRNGHTRAGDEAGPTVALHPAPSRNRRLVIVKVDQRQANSRTADQAQQQRQQQRGRSFVPLFAHPNGQPPRRHRFFGALQPLQRSSFFGYESAGNCGRLAAPASWRWGFFRRCRGPHLPRPVETPSTCGPVSPHLVSLSTLLESPTYFLCLPVCCRLLDLEDLKGNGPAAAAGAGRPPRRRSPVTGESKRVSCCIILVLIYWLTVLLEWVPSGGNAVPAGWLGLFVLVNNNMVTLNTCLPDARWNLQRQAFFHLFRPAFKTVFN